MKVVILCGVQGTRLREETEYGYIAVIRAVNNSVFPNN